MAAIGISLKSAGIDRCSPSFGNSDAFGLFRLNKACGLGTEIGLREAGIVDVSEYITNELVQRLSGIVTGLRWVCGIRVAGW